MFSRYSFPMARKDFSKKISATCLSLAALISCACSDGAASANGDYVRASAVAEEARDAFVAADYQRSLKLARDAEARVRGILKQYPDSDIALRIVTDAGLRLGFCEYAKFRESILPEIETIADPAMAPFDLAWAVAVRAPKNRDAMVANFGTYLAYYPLQMRALASEGAKNGSEISKEALNSMIARCFDFIESSESKLMLTRNVKAAAAACAAPPPAPAAPEAPPAPEKPARLADPEKFLEAAHKDAVMSVYNLEASGRLLEKSALVARDDPAFPGFEKELKLALENVKKISSQKLRNMAVSNVVRAMSRAGLNSEALAGADFIDGDEEAASAALRDITASLSASGDFSSAVGVIGRLRDDSRKSALLSGLSLRMAEAGQTDGAVGVSSLIRDPNARAAAMAEIAAVKWKGDKPGAARILERVDPAALTGQRLAQFCARAGIPSQPYISDRANMLSRLLSIISELSDADEGAAKKWMAGALALADGVEDKNELPPLVVQACKTMLRMGMEQEAAALAEKAMYRGDPQGMFRAFADLGAFASLSGHRKAAADSFKKAAAVINAVDAARVPNSMYLAWQMQASNFDRASAAALLREFLPELK